jgi:hypothetical protein
MVGMQIKVDDVTLLLTLISQIRFQLSKIFLNYTSLVMRVMRLIFFPSGGQKFDYIQYNSNKKIYQMIKKLILGVIRA